MIYKYILFLLLSLLPHFLTAKSILDEESHIKELALQLKNNPNNDKVLFKLGWYMQKRQDTKRAIEFYTKCIKSNETHALAWMNLANIQSKKNLLEKAEYSYRKALLHAPQNAQVYYNLGTFFMKKLNNLEEAENFFLKTIQIKSSYKEAYTNLAFIYLQQYVNSQSKEYLKKAHSILHDIIKKNEKYGPAFYNLAIIAEIQNHREVALMYYQKAKNLYPHKSKKHKIATQKIKKLSLIKE